MNKTVIILLSTYNGEKYIEEQLQSIFAQTYWPHCKLFVRDDGSKDGTVSVLKKYEQQGMLSLECGENIGFVRSFFWLINNAPDADYYSFADQDDVWNADKVERAVKMLEDAASEDSQKPQLYFSDYDFYTADMQYIGCRKTKGNEPTFYESLTDCRAAGFTTVINSKFLAVLKKFPPENIYYHDYFMYMLSFCITKPIYERVPTAKYRRHGNNESISLQEKRRLFLWRLKNFLFTSDSKFANMYKVLEYSDVPLLEEYKKTLHLFTGKRTVAVQLKKLLFPKRLRQKLIDELALRFLFLIGRF